LHKNYAVTTKLSNPTSIVPKCPKDTSAPVPKCQDISDMPKCPRSEVWWVRSVLGPKCPGSEASVHHAQDCGALHHLWRITVLLVLDYGIRRSKKV